MTADLGERLGRAFFARDSSTVARALLGTVIVATSGSDHGDSDRGDVVAVRLTETEAYHGATDPASHAFRGPTARNAVMFGPAGHLYLYFVYGMHWCANIVTGEPGEASAVLLRAGEIVAGQELAALRRSAARPGPKLASGPARLAASGRDPRLRGATATQAELDADARKAWLERFDLSGLASL